MQCVHTRLWIAGDASWWAARDETQRACAREPQLCYFTRAHSVVYFVFWFATAAAATVLAAYRLFFSAPIQAGAALDAEGAAFVGVMLQVYGFTAAYLVVHYFVAVFQSSVFAVLYAMQAENVDAWRRNEPQLHDTVRQAVVDYWFRATFQ